MPEDQVALSIKVSPLMDKRISFVALEHERRTGFRISKSEVIRKLLDIGLEQKGIPNNAEYFKTHKTG